MAKTPPKSAPRPATDDVAAAPVKSGRGGIVCVALWLLGGAVIWGWPSEIWVTAGGVVSGSGSGSGVTMGAGGSGAGEEA